MRMESPLNQRLRRSPPDVVYTPIDVTSFYGCQGLCTNIGLQPTVSGLLSRPPARRCISRVPFGQAQGRLRTRTLETPKAHSRGKKNITAPFPPARPQGVLLGVPPSPPPRGPAPLEPRRWHFQGYDGLSRRGERLKTKGSFPTHPPSGCFAGGSPQAPTIGFAQFAQNVILDPDPIGVQNLGWCRAT